ncbi:hypothetical protein chiPu_0022998, partial [Chiloscyllium punctatum]|nr:hypothetical protein [Chiloscyllium punctatum]
CAPLLNAGNRTPTHQHLARSTLLQRQSSDCHYGCAQGSPPSHTRSACAQGLPPLTHQERLRTRFTTPHTPGAPAHKVHHPSHRERLPTKFTNPPHTRSACADLVRLARFGLKPLVNWKPGSTGGESDCVCVPVAGFSSSCWHWTLGPHPSDTYRLRPGDLQVGAGVMLGVTPRHCMERSRARVVEWGQGQGQGQAGPGSSEGPVIPDRDGSS